MFEIVLQNLSTQQFPADFVSPVFFIALREPLVLYRHLRAFKRIMPVEQIWRKYLPKQPNTYPLLYKGKPIKEFVIKLFAEAGSADPSGRYILNAEAQAAIKPGVPLRIYPAYTYS